MEFGWQLAWSMPHVNCRQLSEFFFAVLCGSYTEDATSWVTASVTWPVTVWTDKLESC
ncbi:putative signal peptide protein [Puccinia sorghi]|uniref:Putative signal peptide protein n=1 Tax=Puccinia sorghi TaxID=27349 RepID=A0A0L6UZU8_9BASI|nr:putative signal peptide protein [Puccinia sorghi]